MKKTTRFFLLLCTAAALSGCVRQTDIPIIAEKTEAPSNQPSGGSTSSGNPSTTHQNQEPSTASSHNPFLEQDTTPDVYQTSVNEAHLTITANTAIDIPDASRILRLTAVNAPYEDADCDAMLKLLSEETGISQWEETPFTLSQSGMPLEEETYVMFGDEETPSGEFIRVEPASHTKSFTSDDQSYRFSFSQGKTSDGSPIMWMNHTTYSDSTSQDIDANDLSDFSLSNQEKTALEKKLNTQAENFLKKWDQGNFSLKQARWKKISQTKNFNLEFTGKYGLRLTYQRTVDGIPILSKLSGWASDSLAPAQYIEFLYMEDGTLLEMKNINREELFFSDEPVDFLLPFNAISQIFEQYMRYYQTVYEPDKYYTYTTWSDGASAAETFLQSYRENTFTPHIYLEVTRVEFAYQLQYDDYDSNTLDKGSGKGRLVPVWAFYGTPRIGFDYIGSTTGSYAVPAPYQVGAADGLLLTINAEDGTVYGKK